MNEQQVRDYLGVLADAVDVGPPPVAEVMNSPRGGVARVVALAGAAALLAAAVVAAVVLAGAGDDPPPPVEPATHVPRQSGTGAWWTPGSIHVTGGTLTVDDSDDPTDDIAWMAPAPDGVVVARVDGTIAAVETSGRITELGHYRTDTRAGSGPAFFVDQTSGLIAWTDGDSLYVYDPTARKVIAERPDSSGHGPGSGFAHSAWLLGFEDGEVYWDDRSGDRIWDWESDTTVAVGGGGSYIHSVHGGRWLVEVDHQTRLAVIEAGGSDDGADPLPMRAWSLPGLSPKGDLVAFFEPRTDGARLVVRSSDNVRGPATDIDLPPGYAEQVTWRDDETLLLVTREAGSEVRTITTCSSTTGACTADEEVRGPVVIAGDAVQKLELR